MPVTLKEVAREAGVSVATASLALNGDRRVNVHTRTRVRTVARQLGYVLDVRGRALRSRRTKVIGLVVDVINSSFYFEIIQAVKARVEADGYTVILGSCQYGSAQQYLDELKRYVDVFRGGLVDGVIFAPGIPSQTRESQLIIDLADNYVPVVFIDVGSQQYGNIPVIKPDMRMAGQIATEHLISLGHERIAFAGVLGEDRALGYLQTMEAHGIQVPDSMVLAGYGSDAINTFEGGLRVGNQLADLSEPPTALVCFSDEVAMGAIQSLVSRGISVPEEMSVVGMDDIDVSAFYNPPLTTVGIQKKEMAIDAAGLLLRMIEGDKIPPEELLVRYGVKLVVRKSTAPARRESRR